MVGHREGVRVERRGAERHLGRTNLVRGVQTGRDALPGSNGTPIENFRYDEKTRQYDWTVWEEYFDNPGAKACEAELAPIDMQWQYQVEDELAPAREERRVKIIECMRAKGGGVDPDLPYPALIVRAVREFSACVEAAFREVAASEWPGPD